MTESFDKDYWESHWQQSNRHASGSDIAPNPYLEREISSLAPNTALDAGCGEGGEAIWLAAAGWQVTAADISSEALSRASERAAKSGVAPERVQWVEADLSVWEPGKQFDLVTTHYAHLDPTQWDIVTADEPIRSLTNRAGQPVELHDVVVRATRRP